MLQFSSLMSPRPPHARHAQRAHRLLQQDTCWIVNNRRQWEPWLIGNALDCYWAQWFDSDRSDLRSNLMQVDTFFLTLLLFAINKAYFE